MVKVKRCSLKKKKSTVTPGEGYLLPSASQADGHYGPEEFTRSKCCASVTAFYLQIKGNYRADPYSPNSRNR